MIPFTLILDYPWSGRLNQNLVHWLYLTDVTKPQNQFLLLSKCDVPVKNMRDELKNAALQ